MGPQTAACGRWDVRLDARAERVADDTLGSSVSGRPGSIHFLGWPPERAQTPYRAPARDPLNIPQKHRKTFRTDGALQQKSGTISAGSQIVAWQGMARLSQPTSDELAKSSLTFSGCLTACPDNAWLQSEAIITIMI